jgi:hypothetical protein
MNVLGMVELLAAAGRKFLESRVSLLCLGNVAIQDFLGSGSIDVKSHT